MPIFYENDIKKLNIDNLSRLYFICGNETYLKSVYTDKICKTAVTQGFEGFNLHVFEQDNFDYNDLSIAIEALPIMSGYNCVYIKNIKLEKLKKDERAAFFEALSDIPDTSVVVVKQADSDNENDYSNSPSEELIKAMSEIGICVLLNRRSESSVVSLLINGAKKRGCELDAATAQFMLTTVGNDLSLLMNELEKLCAYCDGDVITRAAVEECSTKCVEAFVFDLAEHIVKKNADKAYCLLNDLFKKKIDPMAIFGALAMTFSDMYRVKACKLYNNSHLQLKGLFSYNSSFKLNKANELSLSVSISYLRDCQECLDEADAALKSFSEDNKILLERLIARLMILK